MPLFLVTDTNPGDARWEFYSPGGGLPPPIGVPGAVIVEDDTGTAYEQRRLTFDDIDPAFAVTSFSATGVGNLIETGAPLTNPTFTAAYNRPPTFVTIEDNQGGGPDDVTATPNSFGLTADYTAFLGTPDNQVVWTLNAQENTAADSATDSVRSATRTYYGVATDPGGGGYTEAFIESLSNDPLKTNLNETFTETPGAAEFIWWSGPTRLGTPVFRIFGFVEAWTLQATVSVTNAFGFTENYGLWRSVNPGGGTQTVSVSSS